MRISVIIPCHNAGRWIGLALGSVAAQTLPPHEVIVIDDDSTDDSLGRVRGSKVDVRLLRVREHNAAAARNAGIRAAAGDWVALLDADDVWYPNHLERAASLLGVKGDVAFMAHHDWINTHGESVPLPPGLHCPFAAPAARNPHKEFARVMAEGFHFGHSTVLYRRDRVLAVGGFEVSQVRRHDIDLWLRVIEGQTWSYDTVKSAGYRHDSPGSLSKSVPECEYYYLRALLRNEPGYDCPAMRQLIGVAARRAMSLSFVDGDAALQAKVRELAWPRLRPIFRLHYSAASLCPPLLRCAIRLKRQLRTRLRAAPAWRHR
jgi:glycosyltransferase involved in cell wall biosynthesis